MKNRWIAGVLVIALLAWANAAAWPGTQPSHGNVASSGPSGHQHSPNGHHPCCPGKPLQTVFRVPSAPAMPCGSQHRCCVSQSPDLPLSLPVNEGRSCGAEIEGGMAVTAPASVSSKRPIRFLSGDVSRPGFALSMILRV